MGALVAARSRPTAATYEPCGGWVFRVRRNSGAGAEQMGEGSRVITPRKERGSDGSIESGVSGVNVMASTTAPAARSREYCQPD